MTQSHLPSDLEIPDTSGLSELQAHIQRMCTHFNWTTMNERKFLLLAEEIGELAKAMRRMEKIGQEHGKETTHEQARANMAEELADVLNYLLDIANGYGIDLGQAYREKMQRNLGRAWKTG